MDGFLLSLTFLHPLILLSVEFTLLHKILRILDFILDEKDLVLVKKDKTPPFSSGTGSIFITFNLCYISFEM